MVPAKGASSAGKMGVRIVPAHDEHLQEITEIYNEAVRNTTATFDAHPKTLDEQRSWMNEHGGKHPIVVAVCRGEVVGWGSLSRFSDRKCYENAVEDSVYVRKEFRGRGIGRMILRRLIGEARKAGHHAIVARLDAGNEASIALHREMGFEQVGYLKEVGYKFGRWLDVVMMEIVL